MAFPAVIFDLDGTLLDTLEDIGTAANAVLAEFGQTEYPIDQYRTFVGDGVSILFQRAWPATRSQPELLGRAIAAFQRTYRQEWNKRSKPYDGIEELLFRLRQSKVRLAVLSNKPHAFTVQCIEYFFPDAPFDCVYGQRDDFPRKPDPAGVFQIAQEWNMGTELIAYIGDTNTDMETAVSAGCCAIGVSWGFRAVSELIETGAQQTFDSPDELGEFLLR